MAMSIINIVRLVVFGEAELQLLSFGLLMIRGLARAGVVLAFSLIILGLGAHMAAVINAESNLIDYTYGYYGPDLITDDFINLAIAVSCLTIVTIVPLYALFPNLC
jgi:hypothetical protein